MSGYKWLLLSILLLVLVMARAQERCATEKVNPMTPEAREQFETWLQGKKFEIRNQSRLRTDAVTQVPVVVHIIHFGEPVGTGRNITDAQVISQIQVINEDFRRMNPDAGDTPGEFLPVAADTEIEFVLARQDPEGLPTSGIVRTESCQPSWNWSEATSMKSLSYWPADDYLNIWVADLSGPGGNVLGYSTYPTTSLPGVDFGNNPYNDGVAVDFTVFGSSVYYPAGEFNGNYDRGRTLTHELGHFFGLRHIWGDFPDCGASDYCDDTPPQVTATAGCPSVPRDTCTDDSFNDMSENYMDYTYDACMNLFTLDQKGRMQVVLANSPRRLSLTSSHGLNDPVTAADNAGIREIVSPGVLLCEGTFNPQVEIRNYGSNALTSVEVEMKINGISRETKTFQVSMAPLASYTAGFSPVTAVGGEYSFEITAVNGNPDGNAFDNLKSMVSDLPVNVATPYFEDFENGTGDWTIMNPDDNITWTRVTAPSNQANNKAMRMEFYNYENLGETDMMISPVFDLSTAPSPFLHFDVAFAQYPNSDFDKLEVGVITGCELSMVPVCGLPGMDIIYSKTAAELATVAPTSSFFTPQNSSNWRTEGFLSLADYKGIGQVQVVFISTSAYGNNLYIDNVLVTTETSLDIELLAVTSPGVYSCQTQLTPSLKVRNAGSDAISSFTIEYSLDGGNMTGKNFPSVNLPPGAIIDVDMTPLDLSAGEHDLAYIITSINGGADDYLDNNSLDHGFTIDTEVTEPPSRELFEGSSDWIPWAQDPAIEWTVSNGSAKAPFYNKLPPGTETWLFSKVYDFSEVSRTSIFFDVAYSWLGDYDELYLMVSRDCGATFTEALYQKGGSGLATTSPSQNFTPGTDDWRSEFLRLNTLAGEEQVRLAFRAVNQGGNNIYLDNVELFLGDDPTPLESEELVTSPYPNPSRGYSYLTFNLPEKTAVKIRVVDTSGRTVFDQEMKNGLNQTVEIDLSREKMGMYIVLAEGESFRRAWRMALVR